jgi:two-component system, OmpR family, alkaline phosphatase synthesis response regulator PhoP
MNPRILLVEDEPSVRMIVGDLLRDAGYDVEECASGEEAAARLGESFDMFIVDVMMPGQDGFQFCHAARERGFDGAILMLTARTALDDRVTGLRTGADDYVTKPFEPPELLARVTALLRRVRKEALTPVLRFEFGDVTADFASGVVTRDNVRINLAAKELQLLRYLVDHRGRVVTREQLLRDVWSHQPYITPRTVDTHIAWLRQKLEPNPQSPKHILTVRGEGYRFER